MSSSAIDEVTGYIQSTANEHGQPIGLPVPDWMPLARPQRVRIEGRYCRLEPLQPDLHAPDLFEFASVAGDRAGWTYMHYGPFANLTDLRVWMSTFCSSDDPLFFAIIDKSDNRPKGFASYQRITPEHGTIEVGHVYFGSSLRGTAAATEAMYMMMSEAFCMGYRRYEWKCDALNMPSHHAARRFGFTYEGTFRQGNVYKGRNRDISWYSMLDSEWEWLQRAYEEWLSPENFDKHGSQRSKLAECILRSSPVAAGSGAEEGWLIL